MSGSRYPKTATAKTDKPTKIWTLLRLRSLSKIMPLSLIHAEPKNARIY
jgi:hypothetical protein